LIRRCESEAETARSYGATLVETALLAIPFISRVTKTVPEAPCGTTKFT
jgi:hypothetical protein